MRRILKQQNIEYISSEQSEWSDKAERQKRDRMTFLRIIHTKILFFFYLLFIIIIIIIIITLIISLDSENSLVCTFLAVCFSSAMLTNGARYARKVRITGVSLDIVKLELPTHSVHFV